MEKKSNRADLFTQFGDNAVRLRSRAGKRAGKRANLWVFAEKGIACSSREEGLVFLEVFPPRTQGGVRGPHLPRSRPLFR